MPRTLAALTLLLLASATQLAAARHASAGARGPLSSSEKQAVGEALSKALGVVSDKAEPRSKYTICADLFPTGEPANPDDATWQSCKGLLGGVAARGAGGSSAAQHSLRGW
uniref:Uncharacterized protein n=1 Tax=Alexandrium andersonii TaxID=327968 RepID=A0A7S2MWW2_9DINO|mmetsp:Transcript_77791/g.174104  ORF Transcript_77791/g.174104 Transcript_77791/m.174104 type:complete len:111 (+) Transcript_77791:83-415(+)